VIELDEGVAVLPELRRPRALGRGPDSVPRVQGQGCLRRGGAGEQGNTDEQDPAHRLHTVAGP